MKIVVVSFSSRKNGNCSNIASKIKHFYDSEDVIVYDFSMFSISPCGNCEYSCFNNRTDCPFINDPTFEIYDSITNSDLTVFVVPNYCDYPNALYFAFNERSQCYFQHQPDLLDQYEHAKKKFIVISNSPSNNFIQAFKYQTYDNPEVLFLSASKYSKKSIEHDLISSEQALKDLYLFLSNQGG